MKKETKRKLFEWLLSLGVTLLMLGLVLGVQTWYTSATHIELDTKSLWIGNTIGGLVMLLIVHYFVKAPKNEQY